MAQGDITEIESDVHVDLKMNKVTVIIQRIIELPDGTFWTLDTRPESRVYSDTADVTSKPLTALTIEVRTIKDTIEATPNPAPSPLGI